ncbi:hypothetical protein F0Q45_24850 [Mycobacterium simiae]|uniref:Uncharacterized protein n=1 Tax=Mycobacterium simiae TaxID=1784 RepID=A0A5B1B7A6_MYCSI|nr:hypothetical protein [Mycobacterium simiae]KAA1244557.1 hypothetical protein F0Q45_24850 [Mycobacterium simiae]
MKTESFSAEQYNLLLDVNSADQSVHEDQKLARLLEQAGAYFFKFGVDEYYSVELLHKHNTIDPDHIMLEDAEVLGDGTAALTTMKVKRPSREDTFAPSTFKLQTGKLIPLEFSRDPAVNIAIGKLPQHSEFVCAYQRLLADYGLSEFIGLGFAGRRFYDGLRPDQILVEESDPERVANIITIRNRDAIEHAKLISTSWAFKRTIKRCYTATVCVKVCVIYTPGHAIEHRKGTQHRQYEEA